MSYMHVPRPIVSLSVPLSDPGSYCVMCPSAGLSKRLIASEVPSQPCLDVQLWPAAHAFCCGDSQSCDDSQKDACEQVKDYGYIPAALPDSKCYGSPSASLQLPGQVLINPVTCAWMLSSQNVILWAHARWYGTSHMLLLLPTSRCMPSLWMQCQCLL